MYLQRLVLPLMFVLGAGLACNSETPKPAVTPPVIPSAETPVVRSTTSAPTTSGQPAAPAPAAKPVVGKEIVTSTGLRYIDVKIGPGRIPKNGDTVTVHYTGTFVNGTKFDSSYDHPDKQPYPVTLGEHGVIPAWEEALSTMHVGGKRKIIAPPSLAYGSSGRDGIPPNSTLKFDMEIVAIK